MPQRLGQRDRDRCHHDPDCIVGDDLGQDRAEEIDGEQLCRQRNVAHPGLGHLHDEKDGSRRFEGAADREHGEDHDDDLPVDGGEGLVAVDAAGGEDEGDADPGQREAKRAR